MMPTLKKIGITGAGGNIGSTLAEGLRPDYDLTLFDLNTIRSSGTEKRVKIDCASREKITGIFNGLDALIHLAGNPHPNAPRSETMRNNFQATSYVFDEAYRAGVKKIVFASSNFYHENDITRALQGKLNSKITIDMPPTPQSFYGESKVFGESVGRYLAYMNMQFVALRIGWTIPEDNPVLYNGNYMRAVFCSKRDLLQAFIKALEVNTAFLAAFATSDNTRNVFDLTETKKKLGFAPQDNAENYF